MEVVVLPPCKYSENFYCWGLVMVGHVADLVSAEMAVRVEDLDFVEVVVEMAMIIEDFDLEIVGLADFEKMEDIGKIENLP